MTDQDWGDLDALPARRSGAPRWLWACGGGCLLMLLLSMAAGWGMVSWYNEGRKGEDRWTRLEEILPFDERPEAFDLGFGQTLPFWDVEFFLFTSSRCDDADAPVGAERDDDGFAQSEEVEELDSSEESSPRKHSRSLFVVLMYLSGDADDEAMPELIDPDEKGRFEMRIQGRDLTAFRLDEQQRSETWAFAMGPQPSLAVELTLPGTEGRLILLAGREQRGESVTTEEIAKFLAPFHVGLEG